MKKISRVCTLEKKKLNSKGKIQRQEEMVIKEVGKHLTKLKNALITQEQ